jgi:UDP-glucose/GDP-mannose dehydrogenase family, UDP binding domain
MHRLFLQPDQLLHGQFFLPQAQPQIGTVQALVIGVADPRAGVEVPRFHLARQHVQGLGKSLPLALSNARVNVLNLRLLLADEVDQADFLLPGSYQAAESADALVVGTEWNEFRNLYLGRIKESMRGQTLVDAKNILDPHQVSGLGFRYHGVGRS